MGRRGAGVQQGPVRSTFRWAPCGTTTHGATRCGSSCRFAEWTKRSQRCAGRSSATRSTRSTTGCSAACCTSGGSSTPAWRNFATPSISIQASSSWYWLLSGAYAAQGRMDEAVVSAERANELSRGHGMTVALLGRFYGSSGRETEARELLEQLLARRRQSYVPATVLAYIYRGLGELEESARWLDRGIEERDPILVTSLPNLPTLDPLRSGHSVRGPSAEDEPRTSSERPHVGLTVQPGIRRAPPARPAPRCAPAALMTHRPEQVNARPARPAQIDLRPFGDNVALLLASSAPQLAATCSNARRDPAIGQVPFRSSMWWPCTGRRSGESVPEPSARPSSRSGAWGSSRNRSGEESAWPWSRCPTSRRSSHGVQVQ